MACFAVRAFLRPATTKVVRAKDDLASDLIAILYVQNCVDVGEHGGYTYIEVLRDDTDHLWNTPCDQLDGKWPTSSIYQIIVARSGPVVAADAIPVTEEAARKDLHQAGFDN